MCVQSGGMVCCTPRVVVWHGFYMLHHHYAVFRDRHETPPSEFFSSDGKSNRQSITEEYEGRWQYNDLRGNATDGRASAEYTTASAHTRRKLRTFDDPCS
ncbi:hypothetical protein DPSP01_012502 [Paraphaeosphaeria sporulosa]